MGGSPRSARRERARADFVLILIIHFVLLAAVACGLAVLVLIPINFAALPRLSRSRSAGGPAPRVSIVIPARNEERDVGAAVSAHLACDYPDFEVVVVDDGSTDRTREILDALARVNRRLRVVTGKEPPAGWLGKPHALWLGAGAATGELLLFADADVLYDPRCLTEAVAFLAAEGADFLAFLPRLVARGFWENVLLPNLAAAIFFGPGFLANSRWPRWIALGGGAGNLVRRSAYDAIGGHASLKDSVVDDVRLALAVKGAGFRVRATRAEDRVSVRIYRGFREIWNGFSKNMAYIFSGLGAAVFGLSTLLAMAVSIVPPVVLLASLAGAGVSASDLGLAAAGTALAVVARLFLAAALREPLWPSLTHPIMTAVWAAIICRSLYFRIVQRRLAWRGREFDARSARF